MGEGVLHGHVDIGLPCYQFIVVLRQDIDRTCLPAGEKHMPVPSPTTHFYVLAHDITAVRTKASEKDSKTGPVE